MKITGRRSAAAIVVMTAALAGCHSGGPAPSPAEHPAAPAQTVAAESLLLGDGAQMPLGKATAAPIQPGYITSVAPPECGAAMLFKGSPLPPAGSSGYADSAYGFETTASLYAELVNVYDHNLDVAAVIEDARKAVSACTTEAVGTSPAGPSAPEHLGEPTTPSAGVLVWTMSEPQWGCNYAMAVVPSAVLMMSECAATKNFDMAAWAKTRRAQLDKSSA